MNDIAKAARYDAIAERAAREAATLQGEIAVLQECARKLVHTVSTTTESVCAGEPVRRSNGEQIALVESYAREVAMALRDLCEKRRRLEDIQRLIGT